MQKALENEVWLRAAGLCEYCHIPQTYVRLPFQIDHIIAEQHGGKTTSDNLAGTCVRCNKRKGPNIAGSSPGDRRGRPAYSTRTPRSVGDPLSDGMGATLVGMTLIGRVTIAVLDINNPSTVALRESLILEGVVLL